MFSSLSNMKAILSWYHHPNHQYTANTENLHHNLDSVVFWAIQLYLLRVDVWLRYLSRQGMALICSVAIKIPQPKFFQSKRWPEDKNEESSSILIFKKMWMKKWIRVCLWNKLDNWKTKFLRLELWLQLFKQSTYFLIYWTFFSKVCDFFPKKNRNLWLQFYKV